VRTPSGNGCDESRPRRFLIVFHARQTRIHLVSYDQMGQGDYENRKAVDPKNGDARSLLMGQSIAEDSETVLNHTDWNRLRSVFRQ